MATTGQLIKLALNPFNFSARVERTDAAKLIAYAVPLGLAIGLPGAVLGAWLTRGETEVTGSEYSYLAKFFFLPMVWGLCSVLMGLYRAAVAWWPWLDSQSAGAKVLRMFFALVVLSAVGVLALFTVLAV